MIASVIAGLGNPGTAYQNTPHNVGFAVVDQLVRGGYDAPFTDHHSWQETKRFHALTAIVDTIVLVKPQTFMNRSGESIAKTIAYYKVPTDHLFVIHDDISVPFGQLKISVGKNAANHNGVKSVIDAVGTNQFVRFRLGVGSPDGVPLESFVLSTFSPDTQAVIDDLITRTARAVDVALTHGVERAMSALI